MSTNAFVDEVKRHPDMSSSDILNWYRNLYYQTTEEEDATKTIMVKAINNYFMIVRDAIIELKKQKHWESHSHIVEAVNILTENHPERWGI